MKLGGHTLGISAFNVIVECLNLMVMFSNNITSGGGKESIKMANYDDSRQSVAV